MTVARRVGSANSEKRPLLLDVTEQIMLEQGYAAVSSRSVAARAGIKAPLVHYYFPTLDDLFVAVFRRAAQKSLEQMVAALASPEPLLALWNFSTDSWGTGLMAELLAAANHRKVLKSEVVEATGRARRVQIAALDGLLADYGIDADVCPPALVAAAIQGLAIVVVREQALGAATDHHVASAAIDRLLDRLEDARDGVRPPHHSTRAVGAPR